MTSSARTDRAAELAGVAERAMSTAYAPYSGFPVGAALGATDGRVFAGCNVENAAYGVGTCAERVALGAAISAGARSFDLLVIRTGSDAPSPPCGACRQALAEFAPDLTIESYGRAGPPARWRLDELLPHAFRLNAPKPDSE